MATTQLRFIVPRTEIPGVYDLMEADTTPECELRIKRADVSDALRDIVTDGKANVGVREVEITTDEENVGYFRNALGGGRE